MTNSLKDHLSGRVIHGEDVSREIAWGFVYAESVEELEEVGALAQQAPMPEKTREELWQCYMERRREMDLATLQQA
jgi:hypothetical protein